MYIPKNFGAKPSGCYGPAARAPGKSARQVADELGMPQSVLSRWECTADNAQKTPAETLSMEEEVRQLRRENERLRMEREVLKKATAFFAKEST